MADEKVAKRNRSQVIIMLIVFPVLSVFATYSLVWLAGRDTLLETTNHGQFVDPPLLARELGLRDGADLPLVGSGTWWIWMVTEDCDAVCERALEEMRRLRERLHDRADEVRQALVTGPERESRTGFGIDARARNLPAPGRYPQVLRFTSDGAKRLEAGIYLVDPVGNVVLRYPVETRFQPVFEDLARLLEVAADA